MNVSARRDLVLINSAAFLRSMATGLMGVVLGVYLARCGFSPLDIGLVLAAGLAGSAVATFLAGFLGDRFGRRRTLTLLSALMCVAGVVLAFVHGLRFLLPLVFLTMLNGMGTDRSAAFAMEQAILPGLVADERRTWALSWYNLLLDAGGALGALSASIPILLQHWLKVDIGNSYRFVFLIFSGLGLVPAFLYLGLSRKTEVHLVGDLPPAVISPQGKNVTAKLAALFALDSFGGGFLTDALVAYWFFERFGTSEQRLAWLFFVIHILNALSHLGAAWLAKRIGLINTMVFTHLPSSLFLMAVPFAPTLKIAVILILMRESLVEMDVPTRQSYVAAVVAPHERTYASAMTNLSRNVFWALGAGISGLLMQNIAFSAPLVIGGGAKIGYDILLYRAFRRRHPPSSN